MRITISGLPGSGTSTVSKLLSDKYGLDKYSVGQWLRDIADERGVSISELNEDIEDEEKVDEYLDKRQKALNEEDDFVLDSRLGFYFLDDSIDIFLDVSRLESVRRIINDPERSVMGNYNDVKDDIERRIESEQKRFKNLYDVDFLDKTQYDKVIDTDSKKPEEVVEAVSELID